MGSEDQPIDSTGRTELEQLVDSGIYPQAEKLIVSPMLRCRQSAEIIYPDHNAVVCENLRERCFGEFEGLTHGEITAREGYEHWGMNENSMDFPGGEPVEDFFQRVVDAFTQLMGDLESKNVKNLSILLHGGVIMALMQHFGIPRKGYYDWMCKNGRGYVVDWNGENLTLVRSL